MQRFERSGCGAMGSKRSSVATVSITEEDRRVDPHLGYPRAYAKLCRNSYAWMQLQGYALPYGEGPPKKFMPYAAHPDDIIKLEQLQDLFPIIVTDAKKDHSPHLRKYKDVLWQQLDHLGNAGFDPACFRVDAYGNVLYWHADPSSPLAWEICHWFPYSRGGKSVLNNLRIVQWQVSLKRRDKLEFLIPWWDLQLGVSINQFLSVFESPNIGFRQRCLSYLFLGGEEEMPDGKMCISNHQWSHHFLEKRNQCGAAVAGLVRLQKGEDALKLSSSANTKLSACPGAEQKGWTLAEEEALLRGYQQFGFGNWKAIKDSEPILANRSLVQIRDKYRALTGLEKENQHSPIVLSPLRQLRSPTPHDKDGASEYASHPQADRMLSSLKRETKIKLLREEEKHMRKDESAKLQQTLVAIKQQNEQEKAALDALEAELRKQRRQVDKQRQWNETQTSYRICLERMIQETMHQSVVYKEEARLNEIACNSLMAQLESQAATCSAAESRLLQQANKRQDLLQMTRPVPLLESGSVSDNCQEQSSKQLTKVDSHEQSSKQLAKVDGHVDIKKHRNTKLSRPAEARQVLQTRDLQNQPVTSNLDCDKSTSKQESLSDCEEQHRSHKRSRKSTTPAKRYHSAPRQRLGDKENCSALPFRETAPTATKRLLNPVMDKLYYEGAKTMRGKVGESRRTAGHAVNSKVNTSQSENEKAENERPDDKTQSLRTLVEDGNSRAECGDSDGERSGTTRTFKLMPVIKRDETGYTSCGSQRFKGILHAPQSRESSERFELDVSAIDSRVGAGDLSDNAKAGRNSRKGEGQVHQSENWKTFEGGEIDDEANKEGKSTLDKWLQMLLLSTEPTVEADNQESAHEVQEEIKTEVVEEIQQKNQGQRSGWPEDIGVPPPAMIRGYSLRVPEEASHSRSKRTSSDKLKVPFSGLLRRLSLRQQHSSSKAGAAEAEVVKEPPRKQVTFEDWECITNKLAAMDLDSTSSNAVPLKGKSRNSSDTRNLRSSSLRASTGSLIIKDNKNINTSAITLDPSPPPQPKASKSVLYYSTENSSRGGERPMSNLKAMSRRASIDECAQAWKKGVSKLESQQLR